MRVKKSKAKIKRLNNPPSECHSRLVGYEIWDENRENLLYTIEPTSQPSANAALQAYLNPNPLPYPPLHYDVKRVVYCDTPNVPISTTWNFDIICDNGNCPPAQKKPDGTCCSEGFVYCATSDECVPLPDGCDVSQWNSSTCECGNCPPAQQKPDGTCCSEGFVYCATSDECVPLPDGCDVSQWNSSTCTCDECPTGKTNNVTIDIEPSNGGALINSMSGENGEIVTAYTITFTNSAGDAIVFEFPITTPDDTVNAEFPVMLPLPIGDYRYEVTNISLDGVLDCTLIPPITGNITGVKAAKCCEPINYAGGQKGVVIDVEIVPDGVTGDAGHLHGVVAVKTFYVVDRGKVSILNPLTGNYEDIAVSPYVGTSTPIAGLTTQGHWYNDEIGNLLAPSIYPTQQGVSNNPTPANFPFSSPSTGHFHLYYSVYWDGQSPLTVRVTIEGNPINAGTIWRMRPSCPIVNCVTCGEELPAIECANICPPITWKGNVTPFFNFQVDAPFVTPGLLSSGILGGTAPYTIQQVLNLPSGTAYNAANQDISGVISTVGDYDLTVLGIDANNCPFVLPYTLAAEPVCFDISVIDKVAQSRKITIVPSSTTGLVITNWHVLTFGTPANNVTYRKIVISDDVCSCTFSLITVFNGDLSLVNGSTSIDDALDYLDSIAIADLSLVIGATYANSGNNGLVINIGNAISASDYKYRTTCNITSNKAKNASKNG
jgi:hypothetical protein